MIIKSLVVLLILGVFLSPQMSISKEDNPEWYHNYATTTVASWNQRDSEEREYFNGCWGHYAPHRDYENVARYCFPKAQET